MAAPACLSYEAGMAPPLHDIRDPSSGALLGQVPEQSGDEVAAAVARARSAQPAWAALPFRERAKALRTLARAIRDDSELLDTLTRESGKPRYEAELFELLYTLELTRFYTSGKGRRALADELRGSSFLPNKRARVIYHARGVVGVIGPWNWPLLNNFADAIAPLLAGNSVLLKPSEWTPLTSLRIVKLWQALGLPEGVFQVLTGGVETGRTLVQHCDMIFFTGSHRGGSAVAQAAAARMIPSVLELGGKSAMIVLADADLERAARAAVWSGFAHSGQVCIRTERVFVEESVADRFIELCTRETQQLQHGPGADPQVYDVGAMTFPPQMARAKEQVEDAVALGARVLSGGARVTDKAGNYFQPTLIANASSAMRVMNEETFAPVLPIMRVPHVEEALRLTNESTLGLSGSIWSRDIPRARALARRIESGSVCVNDVLFNYLFVDAPLGGVKASGLGIRHGGEALRQFCRMQTIVEDRPLLGFVSNIVARMFGFPYQRKVLELVRRVMKVRY
jgi:acyl-CoA reductase-like NAD-dependent aldehyde dehydrogenase